MTLYVSLVLGAAKVLKGLISLRNSKCKKSEEAERTINMEMDGNDNLLLSYTGGFGTRPRTLTVSTKNDAITCGNKSIEFDPGSGNNLLEFRGTQKGGDCDGLSMTWQFKLTPVQVDALTAGACKKAYDDCIRRPAPATGGRKRKTKRKSKRKSKRRKRKTQRRR